ncbi:MAG: MMPL family transporter [Pseudomonadota bacterium]
MLTLIEKALVFWTEMARRGGVALGVVILASTGAAGWYAANNLTVNTDTSAMLDPDLPFQQRAIALREAFPQIKEDMIVIMRAASLDEADAYAADLRAAIAANKDDFSAVFAPAQEPFFEENGLMYLSEGELESRLTQMTRASGLIETLIQSPQLGTFFSTLAENDELAEQSDLGQETLQALYAELGDVVEASLAGEVRPFSWMGALDEELREKSVHTRLLYATPVLDYSRLQPAKAGIIALREEIEALNAKYDGRVETYITGDPALRVEELEAVTTGIGLSMGLSLILVTILLLLCYRSRSMTVMTLLSLIVTLVMTSAFAAATVGELNLVSVAFTVLLVGLGLDFAIHFLLHVQERRVAGQSNRDALKGAIHEVGPAIALAAPTTALAFLSFVPTRFDGIAQLGVIAGGGVIIAFLVSVTFLPAALKRLPQPTRPQREGAIRAGFAAVEKISGPVSVITVLIGVFALLLMPQVRFDADQMSLRNPASPSVKGFNFLFEDDETIPYRLTRLAGSEEEARASAAAAGALSTVAATRSLPDFVPEDQDAKLELIDFAAGTLVFAFAAEPASVDGPPAREGVAVLKDRLDAAYSDGPAARLAALLGRLDAADDQTIARTEAAVFRFWPQLTDRLAAQLNADFIEVETLPENLRARYLSADGEWRVDILPEADVRDYEALRTFVDDVDGVLDDLTGGAYQSLKAGETISAAMLQATGIAFAIVSVFLFMLVGRARLVLLMLLPLALAAVLTAAAGVLLDIPFNYANVIVLPLLIGIGVDSGIHLVLRHEQVEAGEGVYGTSTPRAVLFSALTTLASFGSLMLSPHRGTASMGELLTVAILFTLICTLVVLPAAFTYAQRRLDGVTIGSEGLRYKDK